MEIYNGTYCVYIHTNKINGKMYVGQTVNGNDPNKRWLNGLGYRTQQYFWRAIKKYGWDNFEHEVIASNLTKEEADNFEKLLIKELDTMNKDKGYNIVAGGQGSSGYHPSEETRKKIGEASRKNNELGLLNTEEIRKKNSEWHKNNPLPGQFKKGQTPWNKGCSPVMCVETGEIFSGAHEAEAKTGISNANITAVCKGKKGRKTAGGFHWKYYTEETNVA